MCATTLVTEQLLADAAGAECVYSAAPRVLKLVATSGFWKLKKMEMRRPLAVTRSAFVTVILCHGTAQLRQHVQRFPAPRCSGQKLRRTPRRLKGNWPTVSRVHRSDGPVLVSDVAKLII